MNRKSALASSRLPLSLAALGLVALGCVFPVSPARALEEGAGEAKAIDACDKRLCTILQQKNPSGRGPQVRADQDVGEVHPQGGPTAR